MRFESHSRIAASVVRNGVRSPAEENELIRHSSTFIGTSALIAVLAVSCLQITTLAQATSTQSASNAEAEVAAIMDDVLKRGEGQVGDVKTNTWVPPSPADIERIQRVGHDAIEPLSRCLDSRRPFMRILAVRFLGEIGGADVLPPLKRALEPNEQNSVRIYALAALRSVPDELALPIIRNAVHDSDPLVAERAKSLLTGYYQLPVPP
jgi:HEAT repeat protein